MNKRAGKVDGSGVRPPRRQAAPRVLSVPTLAERIAAEVPAGLAAAHTLAKVYDLICGHRGEIEAEMTAAVLAIINQRGV